MKIAREGISRHLSLVFVSILFLGAALGLAYGRARLAEGLDELREEYQVDLDLSENKAARLAAYAKILEGAQVPDAQPMDPNKWIQKVQSEVTRQGLSLQELKPMHGQGKGDRRTHLYLVAEGPMDSVLKNLYGLAEAADLVYVKQLSLTVPSESVNKVRAQMVLSQMQRSGKHYDP